MSAAVNEEWDDLLPDDLTPEAPSRGQVRSKKGATPLVRSAKQRAAAVKRAEEKAVEAELRSAQDAAKAQAARLAQVVNLHIAGYSLADIGASIGATAEEVDRMLANDTQRYVRNQPALRTYVRNFISGKYTELLDTVWDRATDSKHSENLEAQDRALRILDRMGRLHGAEAPVQKEIHVEAAPEAVERLVAALAANQGMGYDVDIFDGEIVEAEVVHEAPAQALAALERAASVVEEPQPGDEDGL